MKRFKRENFKEGRILFGLNKHSSFAMMIRMLGSVYNHNATSAISRKGVLGFNEAMPPQSQHTSLEAYERLMNRDDYVVRVYRLRGVSDEEHAEMAKYFTDYLLNLPYPKKRRMVLLASHLYNFLYDNINGMPAFLRLNWCTKLCQEAVHAIRTDFFKSIWGKVKKLPTPRTFEKRALEGLLIDETDLWIEEVTE